MPDWLVGFKTILMGMPGSGKTTAMVTALQAGFEVFGIFTEQGMGNFMKAARLAGLSEDDMKRFHFTYIKPGATDFKTLQTNSKAIQDAIKFGEMANQSRKNYGAFIKVINACGNFVDQHGVEFGSVAEFKANRLLFVDGMSNLAKMAMQLTVGSKPVKTQQDWGVAIETLENLEQEMVSITAPFVLVAHMEREVDEITRAGFVTVATLGQKYPMRISRNYNDVILATHKNGEFNWATTDREAQLKGSYLPIEAKQAPDFRPLVCGWLAENGIIDFKNMKVI
jgi:hypothetical protein